MWRALPDGPCKPRFNAAGGRQRSEANQINCVAAHALLSVSSVQPTNTSDTELPLTLPRDRFADLRLLFD